MSGTFHSGRKILWSVMINNDAAKVGMQAVFGRRLPLIFCYGIANIFGLNKNSYCIFALLRLHRKRTE